MDRLVALLLLFVTAAVAQDTDKVCFYTDVNYEGTQLCGIEGERIDAFQKHNSLNDEFSSVKVPVGLQVLAFFDDGFHGFSMTFREDTPNLGSFSDRISSFVVQRAEACFYTGKQYAGAEHCISLSDAVDVSTETMLNDNFESVKIPQGLLVKVFTDPGLQGRLTWFLTDTADLGEFNNVISSLIVEYDNQVCFYTNNVYQGTSICAKPGEAHDVRGTSMNDAFSSVRVPHDLFVIAYVDDDYHGSPRMYTADVSNLNDFNDQITSFVVGFSGTSCFYTEINWGGNKFCAPYGDRIDVATNFNSFNDRFQSVIIPDDLQVKTYMHGRYEGEMVSYNTATRNFGVFSNMISSFEVTSATTTPYDNFPDSEIMALENRQNTFNLTVCSLINSQGSWNLLYNDSCLSDSKRYACNNIYTPNLWRISSTAGAISNGIQTCQSQFGSDFTFGTPINSHSNSLLSSVVPSGGVWINLYYDSFRNEYSHRSRRSTDCGGPNQGACDDGSSESYICSLPLLSSLFGCREPYCNKGLTRHLVLQGEYICRCSTNLRVRRGIHDAVLGACSAANVVPMALTGEEILERLLVTRPSNPTRSMLEMAWRLSFIGRNLLQERGGWIYANPSDPTDLQVVLAPSTASGTFRTNGQNNPAINLEGASRANARQGWVLVANFHTHPLDANPEPSTADLRNAIQRGVPGIVISRRYMYVYGPERRANFRPLLNPRNYPEDGDISNFNPNARGSVRRVRENPFPRPDQDL